jgi:hypothetical protein
LSAQEEERKEISRELHDEIVQTLTGINVQLASLKIESGVSKKSFSKHISYTQRLVEKSVDIVHQFARDLRPTLLDDLGLIPALHAYLKAFTDDRAAGRLLDLCRGREAEQRQADRALPGGPGRPRQHGPARAGQQRQRAIKDLPSGGAHGDQGRRQVV